MLVQVIDDLIIGLRLININSEFSNQFCYIKDIIKGTLHNIFGYIKYGCTFLSACGDFISC